MKTPDITPVQIIVGVVSSTIGLLVSFGVGITTDQQNAILAFVGTLSTAALLADAYIRRGRAIMQGKIEMARVILPSNDD